MKLLFTDSPAGALQPLADALAKSHSVTTRRLREGEPVDWPSLLRGVDAVIHGAGFHLPSEAGAIAQAGFDAYSLGKALAASPTQRVIVLSRLEIHDAYDPRYLIDETWRPQPRPIAGELGPFIIESILREFARTGETRGLTLRLRKAELTDNPADACRAIEAALAVDFPPHGYRWHVCHVSRVPRFLTFEAKQLLGLDLRKEKEWPDETDYHSKQKPPEPAGGVQPGGRVVVIGAGGGVGCALWNRLRSEYELVLADRNGLAEARTVSASWAQAELPASMKWTHVDVTDLNSVRAAVRGAGAVINLTVVRNEVPGAFAVNLGGACNVSRACAEAGVRRLIHTGPWARVNGFEGDYRYAYDITEGAPYAAGTRPYPHTKSMSALVARSFAESEGLETFTYWISRIRPADALDGRDNDVFIPFSVSWEDLAEAFACGLRAPSTGHWYEEFFIGASSPQEKVHFDKARHLLGWSASDDFRQFYTRPPRSRPQEKD